MSNFQAVAVTLVAPLVIGVMYALPERSGGVRRRRRCPMSFWPAEIINANGIKPRSSFVVDGAKEMANKLNKFES